MRSTFAVLLLAAGMADAAPESKGTPDFQRVIRPLLSEACFHCHGPDKGTRMMGLRLDTKDGAFEKRKTGQVIVPGNPEASLLYQRVIQHKDALRMPPVSSGKKLTPEQKESIRSWIASGAPWKEHWSFQALERPNPPSVRNAKWVRNPIDNFVLARLESAGLSPAAEADRRTLIRRVSLDLTGLPPTPADVESFVNDPAPDAYEKLVDRLLASPRYGEHRARYWLDAARYADTHGLHVDNYREMWSYRDWVIDAFNRNVPFDTFTVEQIAGDLLPNPTLAQRIATGFNRCNVTTSEAGSIEEEVQAMYAKDRVETTSTVWLGMTTGCASCHDHKFDPIPTKDFYSFSAFFTNTNQRAMDGNVKDTPPILTVPLESDRARWDDLRAKLGAKETQMDARKQQALAKLDSRMKGLQKLVGRPAFEKDVELFTWKPAEVPKGARLGKGPMGGLPAVHFEEKEKIELKPLAGPDTNTPFTIATWVYLPKSVENVLVATQSMKVERKEDDKRPAGKGWSLEINDRIPLLKILADTSVQVRGNNLERLKTGEWAHIVYTYDGTGYQGGVKLYVNGKQAAVEGGDSGRRLKEPFLATGPLRLGGDGTKFLQGGAIADFRLLSREVNEEEVRVLWAWPRIQEMLAKKEKISAAEDRELLNLVYLTRKDGAFVKMQNELRQLQGELRTIRYRSPVTHVMQERSDRMPMANVLFRGQYDQPREKVEPAVPSVLPPMAKDLPRNRLGLAKWLVDPSNPLPARVTVNRFWQEAFGAGIVKTAEDFGSQGEPPTHPELLDWMAVEFRESWDVKKFIRLLVTSSTYRQAAVATDEKLKADPENRLLSRGPRFRMDGEVIRDMALSASGLLNPAIGGPSVRPYQPTGIWETVAMKGSDTESYTQDHGDKLYRRSMYTFWKRSAPPASMDIFNAPTREQCTVRRERTNTPLQALVTLNDVQFVEAARNLAQGVLKSGGEFDQKLDVLTTTVLARPFTTREREIARKGWRGFMSYFDSHPDRAEKLLLVGESKRDASLTAPEFAAWTMLASDVLNLDEALTK